MTEYELENLARIAYEAYGEITNWKNYRGDPMPLFDDLGPVIQNAWKAASLAAARSSAATLIARTNAWLTLH